MNEQARAEEQSEMLVETVPVGPFEVNAYLCHRQENGWLVVDPGADGEQLVDRIEHLGGRSVSAYLLTHGHADHICGLAAMHARYPAPVYMHPRDRAWAFSAGNQIPPFYPQPVAPQTDFLEAHEGMTKADSFELHILETPGHSPGGVCYYLPREGLLFSGDTLFRESVGRTDLPGGDSRQLAQSLQRLAGLAPSLRVLPGHGPATTIAEEKRHNYYLRGN